MLSSSGRRIGFGSMQLTGPGHWAAPDNLEQAMQVLRDAIDAGVTHIDTADAYGPFTVEKYIRRALRPYPEGLVIATKGGLTRQGPNQWSPCGQPNYLRQCVEMSLRRLQVERIDLYYLHRIDPAVPLEDQLGVLRDMQAEGKIGSIAFVPYAPLASGGLAEPHGVLHELATQYSATPAQLALAWLLHRSPVMMPIPGTSCSARLHENLAAHQISLTREAMTLIELAATKPHSSDELRGQKPGGGEDESQALL